MAEKEMRRLKEAFVKAKPQKAVRMLERLKTDEEYLVCVMACKNRSVALAAVNKIVDPALLVMIAQTLEFTCPVIAEKAGKRIAECIQDPQLLTKMIFDESVPGNVKSAALGHIDDTGCLAMMALNHPSEYWRMRAIGVLLQLEPRHPAFPQILMKEQDRHAVEALIKRIDDISPQSLLAIALRNPHLLTRKIAAEMILKNASNKEFAEIEQLAEHSQDEEISCRAITRIQYVKRLRDEEENRKREEENSKIEQCRIDAVRAFVQQTDDIRTLLDYAQQTGEEKHSEIVRDKLYNMPPDDVAAALTEQDAFFVDETINNLFRGYRTRLVALLRCIYQKGLFTKQIAVHKGQYTYREIYSDECGNSRDILSEPFDL